MSKTVVPASNPPPAVGPGPTVRHKHAGAGHVLRKILMPIASLRITVVLFALAIVLVFLGTVAQKDEGLWTVLHQYFRSLIAWIPLQVFVRFGQVFFRVPPDAHLSGRFPFPGGWLIGGLLLVNLLAAHFVRFKISWKRSGILLIHAGLVIMMVSELVTGVFAVESKMTLAAGESANFVDVTNEVELALTDTSDPEHDTVVVIPGSILERGGVIQHDKLPVDVEVFEYQKNSDIQPAKEGDTDAVTGTDGRRYVVHARPEGAGVDSNEHDDAPTTRVALRKKGTNETLGTYTLSLWFYPNFSARMFEFVPQRVTVDGKSYTVELRRKRIYKPYAIKLKEFHHDRYIGTDIPKNYSSTVQLADPERNEDREVSISMNAPLRYSGDTLYQSGFLPADAGTVLQVVRNPGWLMPYISCVMVTVGMVIHFCLHLLGFLERRGAK